MHLDDLGKFFPRCGKPGNKTLLAIMASSKNVVDACINVTKLTKIPSQLVCTRRQVECDELGGGYVNNWTTEKFAEYVKSQGVEDRLILTRHGGLWQRHAEAAFSPTKALNASVKSFLTDVEAGFDVLHVDALHSRKHIEKIVSACEDLGKNVSYECGSMPAESFEDLVKFCSELTPKIKFVSGDTGTQVKDMRNVGKYDNKHARALVETCNKHNIWFKANDVDYVDLISLKDYPDAGIHAATLSLELSAAETVKLLELLDRFKLKKEKKRFLEIAYDSKKWEKWVTSKLSSQEKSTICGHYVYDVPEVVDIRYKLGKLMPHMDDVLQTEITTHILKYMRAFAWLH